MDEDAKHKDLSSIREEYVEYVFLASLCSYAWQKNRFVEIARSSTDAFGYDVILTCNGITRHVQLKATKEGGKAAFQTINTNLAKAPSGCVVWLYVDPRSLVPKRFGWFGAEPGGPLPDLGDKVGRHTKGNAEGEKLERPGSRQLKKAKFVWLDEIEQVFDNLFGSKE